MKIPTLNLPKKKLLIASSVAVGAVLTPFITYACYQNINKPAKPNNPVAQEQKVEEKKIEAAKSATESAPVTAAQTTPAVKPSPVPATKPTTTPTKQKTEVKKETPPQNGVSSISLLSSANMVKWQVAGYSAKGFKVVWSKSSGPTYPTRSSDQYHYISNPSAYKDYIDGFDGPGQYYVRVCEYLGGGCGVYSNQIVVTLN